MVELGRKVGERVVEGDQIIDVELESGEVPKVSFTKDGSRVVKDGKEEV